MSGRRPTIRDVAALAGVGVKTVSRVLNNEPYVSEATRARVRAAIEQLGFRPNPAAQALRRTVARSIAFVCENTSEPFSAELASAIEHAVGDRAAVLTASTFGDPIRELTVLESLIARQLDGVVLAPGGTDLAPLLRRLGRTALVCVDRPAPGLVTDVVLSDNVGGMADAVELLVERGHRRIAFFGDAPGLLTQRERLAGYRGALRRHGLRWDPVLVHQHPPDSARVARQLRYLTQVPSPPTAYVSANSLTTLDLIHAGFDAGGSNVVAFDDFPLADVVSGGITVVVQDAQALGVEAAERLFGRIARDDVPPRTVRVPTRLMDRSRA